LASPSLVSNLIPTSFSLSSFTSSAQERLGLLPHGRRGRRSAGERWRGRRAGLARCRAQVGVRAGAERRAARLGERQQAAGGQARAGGCSRPTARGRGALARCCGRRAAGASARSGGERGPGARGRRGRWRWWLGAQEPRRRRQQG
jgi:hypothetical protein